MNDYPTKTNHMTITVRRVSMRSMRGVAVAICMGVTTLLLLLGGANAARAASADVSTLQVSHNPQPTHDGEGDGPDELYGRLIVTATSFVGEWIIAAQAQQPITVVLDANTEVRKFNSQLPAVGEWLKVEGRYLSDGRFRAAKVRPDSSESNQVIVRLKPAPDPEAVVRALALDYELYVESVLRSANIYLFTTTEDEEDDLAQLLADERIDWAELNRVSRVPTGSPYRTWKWGSAEDSAYSNQQAFAQVNLPPAAGIASGAGVTVAILDTGVDLQHPSFAGNLAVGPGSDMIADTNVPDDIGPGEAWGHGTHIAGVVHAIAPDAQLMPLRVLDSQGRGNTFVLAYAIEYAVARGAQVINLSLGADCTSHTLNAAVSAATAQGIVIVAAAGNDASPAPQCPASLPGVLSVAAVEESRVRADWSNYGEWVLMAAPGVGITSTFPLGYGVEITATPGYASWSGTSMATPFVSGAAALLLERNADFLHEMTVADRLATYGDDISALNPQPLLVGRHLNIANALLSDLPEKPTSPTFSIFLPSVTR